MNNVYDFVIIGGGVVGSAIARELSRYKCNTCVLEKNLDVCYETSGRNSGVVHGGFAYDTGTWKAKLCVAGNQMMDEVAKELDFKFVRCGKVLVGQTKEDEEKLKSIIKQGEANGASGLSIIDEDELHRLVPKAVGKVAMFSKNSGIVDPFNMTIALAENAAQNGVTYELDNEVIGIERKDNLWHIQTTKDKYVTKWVINSAGLGAGKVSAMLGIDEYKIIGSKGDYIILDKRMGELLPMPVYPVPSNTYMGIHVTNTVDGNVIIGPDAEQTENYSYYGVGQDSMDYLAKSASDIWPCINRADYIRNYCGILPKWVDKNGVIQDFKMELDEAKAPNVINLLGMESPALTAAVPIGKHIVDMILEKEDLEENKDFNPIRKGIPRFAELSKEEQEKLIKEDPDYGELICRCEKVSKAEILRAIHNPLHVQTLVGIKYRTRSMMGRCQGGYCQMRVSELIRQENNISKEDFEYNRKGSYMFTGDVRKESK